MTILCRMSKDKIFIAGNRARKKQLPLLPGISCIGIMTKKKDTY